MRDLAKIFKALADETRLKALALLLENDELCVCRFVEVLGVTQSKASRHLRYLLNAGLVRDRRDAVWVHYRLAEDLDPRLTALLQALKQALDRGLLKELRRALSNCCGPAGAKPVPRRKRRKK